MSAFQKVTHDNATYQTRWPLTTFRSWMNVELSADGKSTISRKVECLHCRNQGMVILDHTNDGVACPMCSLGRLQNASWRAPFKFDGNGRPVTKALPVEEWCWRPSDDMSQWSWNHGLSVDHTKACPDCLHEPVIPGGTCPGCVSRRKKRMEMEAAA